MRRVRHQASLEDPWIGARVAERYEVMRRVAEREVVRVYLARELTTGRPIALKRISPPELSARFLLRFRTSAYHVAWLDDPRIVPVLDYALLGADALVVMEWMPGHTLEDYLEADGRLPPLLALQVGTWLAQALDALHQRGLVHLGLTPRNVFLDSAVGLKVADAGLARVLSDTGLTITGHGFAYKIAYLAPEQLTYARLDPTADVYAWGVIMCRALTGQLPFPQQTVAGLLQAPHGVLESAEVYPATLIPGIPPPLDTLVAECLAVDAEQRPRTGAELVRRLAALPPEVFETVHMRAAQATQKHHRPRRRLTIPRGPTHQTGEP